MSNAVEILKQERIEKEAKIYNKLSVQVNHQISTLKSQIKDAASKKNDPKVSEVTRAVWMGMHTAYSNALSELELANDRAHYDF